jgi:hypothetical protein
VAYQKFKVNCVIPPQDRIVKADGMSFQLVDPALVQDMKIGAPVEKSWVPAHYWVVMEFHATRVDGAEQRQQQ